jgi:hypothetical protein
MFLSTWKTLFRQKVILVSAVSIALINSATSVLPAIIGVALIKLGAQNSYSTSFIICLGLTITIILNRKISQLTMKFFVNSFIAWSVVPLILVVCFVYFKLNLLSLIVMYATACVGSNIRSIGSGSIRLSAVPRAIFANVNSAYAAVIYIGQILGAFFIVDRLEESFSSTLIITIVLLLLGMFFSMLHLPKVSFKTFLEKKLLSEDSGLNL